MTQFLETYYKSISLINIFTFSCKNKYFIIFYILMGVTSFCLNTNIEFAREFFQDLDVYKVSILNFKFFIIYIIISYLSFTKFTVIFKILSLLRSISFFYKEIKSIPPSSRYLPLIPPFLPVRGRDTTLPAKPFAPYLSCVLYFPLPNRIKEPLREGTGRKEKTKNIISIMIFYFILNIFFTVILILFITNLSSNLYLINLELGKYTYCYSNIISFIMVFMFLESFLGRKFSIKNNHINLSVIILNIILTFGPFICLNFYLSIYPSLYPNGRVLRDYQDILDKFLDYFIIHCESRDDSNFNYKLKGTDRITTSVLPYGSESETSNKGLTANNNFNNTMNNLISTSSSNININSNISIETNITNSSQISLNNTSNATSSANVVVNTRTTPTEKGLNFSERFTVYINKLVKSLTIKFQGKPEFDKFYLFEHNNSTDTITSYTYVKAPKNLGFSFNDITEMEQINSKSLNEIFYVLKVYTYLNGCNYFDLLQSEIALKNFNNFFLKYKIEEAADTNPFGFQFPSDSESDLPNFCKHYKIDRIITTDVTIDILDLIIDKTYTPEEKELYKYHMGLFTK